MVQDISSGYEAERTTFSLHPRCRDSTPTEVTASGKEAETGYAYSNILQPLALSHVLGPVVLGMVNLLVSYY